MKIIKIFYDLETTGLDPKKHSLHQLSGIIDINDVTVEAFDIKSRPHPKALIEPAALRIAGKTEEQILGYQDMKSAHGEFTSLLGKYINKRDPKDKAYLIGFNNASFDNDFLRMFFELNGDPFMMSWFWSDNLDVMALASQYLMDRRRGMPSFKLKRVAKELGIEIDESQLHDAAYDVYLTRKIYRIVTNLEVEPWLE